MQRLIAGTIALLIAAVIWLPCLHCFFFRPAAKFRQPQGLSPAATELAARHLQLWTEPAQRDAELRKMRVSNAEWDFMGRSVLNGTVGSVALGWKLSGFLAVIYILFYLAFVVLAPILVLAAGLLLAWQKIGERRAAHPDRRRAWLAEL